MGGGEVRDRGEQGRGARYGQSTIAKVRMWQENADLTFSRLISFIPFNRRLRSPNACSITMRAPACTMAKTRPYYSLLTSLFSPCPRRKQKAHAGVLLVGKEVLSCLQKVTVLLPVAESITTETSSLHPGQPTS